jgi:DNA-binding transcriptional regulator YdaS (Cro superfamily)
MELKTWINAKRGRATQLARDLDVAAPVVSRWRNGTKAVPLARCAAIETATGGAVTRQALRPDDWYVHWPELICTSTHQPPDRFVSF